jgi:hypothetical protein
LFPGLLQEGGTLLPRLETLQHRRHPHLYEINAWVWLEELSKNHGREIRLASVPDAEWDRLAAHGFDFVWLMGVWERSVAGRQMARTDLELFPHFDAALPGWQLENVVGSGYSVKAYRPDPRMGTWEELDAVRAKLRERGMGLILDFVTNHTGRDHHWVSEHPEFYIQGALADFRRDPHTFFLVEHAKQGPLFLACGRDPFFPAWRDTAQLNYFHQGARRAVIEELKSIAEHCDGVRCDMAMLVLNDVFESTWRLVLAHDPAPAEEFWPQAVAALPGFIWIAEVYWDLEWRMQKLGFQFTYDKRLMDRLHGAPPREVRDHLRADIAYQHRSVRFLENHDEPRSAAVFGKERLPAVAALVAMLPGMRFYHHGQFDGRTIRPPVHLGAAADEAPDAELRALYDALLRASDEDTCHDGEWRLLEAQGAGDATQENLVAYEWRSGAARAVVVVNLSGEISQGSIHLEGIEAGRSYDLHDQLHDVHYNREGHELLDHGLYIRLGAFQAHIFAVNA